MGASALPAATTAAADPEGVSPALVFDHKLIVPASPLLFDCAKQLIVG